MKRQQQTRLAYIAKCLIYLVTVAAPHYSAGAPQDHYAVSRYMAVSEQIVIADPSESEHIWRLGGKVCPLDGRAICVNKASRSRIVVRGWDDGAPSGFCRHGGREFDVFARSENLHGVLANGTGPRNIEVCCGSSPSDVIRNSDDGPLTFNERRIKQIDHFHKNKWSQFLMKSSPPLLDGGVKPFLLLFNRDIKRLSVFLQSIVNRGIQFLSGFGKARYLRILLDAIPNKNNDIDNGKKTNDASEYDVQLVANSGLLPPLTKGLLAPLALLGSLIAGVLAGVYCVLSLCFIRRWWGIRVAICVFAMVAFALIFHWSLRAIISPLV